MKLQVESVLHPLFHRVEMANIAVARIKREFKEVVTSEEVMANLLYGNARCQMSLDLTLDFVYFPWFGSNILGLFSLRVECL